MGTATRRETAREGMGIPGAKIRMESVIACTTAVKIKA
jgi:hypothetical protein